MKPNSVNKECHIKYLVMSKHEMSQSSVLYKSMSQSKERWRLFGAYIKSEREKANLSQEGLGDLIGRDRQTIYRIENAIAGTTRETVLKLAEAMALDVGNTLNKAGFSLQDEDVFSLDTYEIYPDIQIIFQNGKKVPKKKQEEILNAARHIARGVMADDETE